MGVRRAANRADVVGGLPWHEHLDEDARSHIDFCFDLAKKYDKDGDYAISRNEFTGASEDFRRLDRNGDGVLRGEDMYGTVLHFPKYLNEIYMQEVG